MSQNFFKLVEAIRSQFLSIQTITEEQARYLPTTTYSEDSISDLPLLWHKLRINYFPDRIDLDEYKVSWSYRKHSSTLASCNIKRKNIIVASAMQSQVASEYLEPLLYHEMCHAVLGPPKVVNGKRIMHGRDFKQLERKHPQIKALNAWIKAGGWRKAVTAANNKKFTSFN